jgi:hypothetical protein
MRISQPFCSFPSTFVAVARGQEGILLLHFRPINSVIYDLLEQYMPVAFVVDLVNMFSAIALALSDALCPSGYSTSSILVYRIVLLFALPIGNPLLSFKHFVTRANLGLSLAFVWRAPCSGMCRQPRLV